MKPSRYHWMQLWAFVCVVSAALLTNCGKDMTSKEGETTPADAGTDTGIVADAGLTAVEKATICRSNATDSLVMCGCEQCPTSVYDCFYANNRVAAACSTIIECVRSSGCTDSITCTGACSSIIQQNMAGVQAVLAVQNCAKTLCFNETSLGRNDAGDGTVADAAVDVGAPDAAPSDSAAPAADRQ